MNRILWRFDPTIGGRIWIFPGSSVLLLPSLHSFPPYPLPSLKSFGVNSGQQGWYLYLTWAQKKRTPSLVNKETYKPYSNLLLLFFKMFSFSQEQYFWTRCWWQSFSFIETFFIIAMLPLDFTTMLECSPQVMNSYIQILPNLFFFFYSTLSGSLWTA